MATPPSSARKRGRPAAAASWSSSSVSSSWSSSSSSSSSSAAAAAAASSAAHKRLKDDSQVGSGAVQQQQAIPCQGTRKDGSACNRKAKGDCAHGRCVACCQKLGRECAAHEALIKKRKEEEAMLAGEEALSEDENTALRIYPGDFKETSFEVIGDTVVLFSLQDFLCNPKWHKDSLERGLRRRRGKRGLKGPGHTQRGVMRSKREVGLAQASLKAEKGRRVLARLQAAAGVVV